MSEYIMNRESLKRHCEATCHKFKDIPTSGTYREHRLVLDLIEQTEWIPVSERLPEDRMACLVYGKMHFIPDHVDEKNWFYDYSIGCFNSAFGWSIRGDMEVIAWMPLPQPYKAESEKYK